MAHAILIFIAFIYCLPALAWKFQLAACHDILVYASDPLIAKRVAGKRFNGNIQETVYRQHTLRYRLFPTWILTMICFGLTWYAYGTNQPFEGEWELYVVSGVLAWMMTLFWKWRTIPIWQYNWQIELIRAHHLINLELIHERVRSIRDEIAAMEEPKTADEMYKLNNFVMLIEYCLLQADEIEKAMKNVPEPIVEQ